MVSSYYPLMNVVVSQVSWRPMVSDYETHIALQAGKQCRTLSGSVPRKNHDCKTGHFKTNLNPEIISSWESTMSSSRCRMHSVCMRLNGRNLLFKLLRPTEITCEVMESTLFLECSSWYTQHGKITWINNEFCWFCFSFHCRNWPASPPGLLPPEKF